MSASADHQSSKAKYSTCRESRGNTPMRTACGKCDDPPLKKRRLSIPKCNGMAEADISLQTPAFGKLLQNDVSGCTLWSPDEGWEPESFDLRAVCTLYGVDKCISSSIGSYNDNERQRLGVGDETAATSANILLPKSGKLKKADENLSAKPKNFDFRFMAKNFTTDAESDILKMMPDYSADRFSKGRKRLPKIRRMRKKIEQKHISLLWKRTPTVAQWTGGTVAVVSRPEVDKRARLFQCVGNVDVSAENIGIPNVVASTQKDVAGISEAVHDRRASAGHENIGSCPPGASERVTDGRADATPLPTHPKSKVQAAVDKSKIVEGLLNNQRDLLEKIVNADAKLTEDVGNDAEKVVTYRDPQDLNVSENGGMFNCPFCPLHFSRYSDIERHCLRRHYEGWSYTENALLRMLVPYRPEGFLESHPRLKFKCIFCSMLFPSHDDLSGHLAERHYGDYPFECPFCAKRFKNSPSYSGHLDAHIIQANYPSYECNACTASFSSPWELNLHSEVHDRLSPIIVD